VPKRWPLAARLLETTLILAVGNDGQYAKFCDVAGHPELALNARFAKNTDRVKNRQILVPLLEKISADANQSRLACGT
jgi:crotonobetainyl-CoA:carnitine CoA-transferase CaiB-like acyl-CoA transferase